MYLATRLLVRTALSRYEPVAPAAWRFESNEHGRPFVPRSPLSFSLSNTRGLVVCAVARHLELGVDAELCSRAMCRSKSLSSTAPAEAAALRALPPACQPLRFLEYWTLKESYIKARGLGLTLPLDRFRFVFDEQHTPHIEFDTCLGDDGASWRFMQFRLRSHLVALCVRLGSKSELKVLTGWRVLFDS